VTEKGLGKRPAVVESRITAPVKPHKPKLMTPQEWKFVEEFAAGDGHVTLKEAALRAGYTESWAQGKARDLTDPEKNPHVVAAIQERRRELGEKYGTTFERHMRDLQLIRDQALQAGAYGAAVQAEYRRGQALGTIYIDRKEIRHGTIDSMSKDEVMRKLQEIKRLYGGAAGPVVDITPKDIGQDPEVIEMQEPAPAGEESDVDQTGESAVSEAPRKPRKLPYIPD
jgi:phage terminase small subunit